MTAGATPPDGKIGENKSVFGNGKILNYSSK
jgi:hypothetical protein